MQAGEDHARVAGRSVVEVTAHDRAALDHQTLDGDVGTHDDPLARRRTGRSLTHDIDDTSDRAELGSERLLGVGQVRRGQLEVAVGVDDTGDHDPAGEVDGLDTGCGQRQHLLSGADGGDAPAPRQQALRERPGIVLGVDLPADVRNVVHGEEDTSIAVTPRMKHHITGGGYRDEYQLLCLHL